MKLTALIPVYERAKAWLQSHGYAAEVSWARDVCLEHHCPDSFFLEYMHVVVNSGMRAEVAEIICKRIIEALALNRPLAQAFGHKGKREAIEQVLQNRNALFDEFRSAGNKLGWLQGLPWIGPITKFHLARNLGLDVLKPDRHLQRLASRYGTDAQSMGAFLADATGDRIGVVDAVLWRACKEEIVS